MTFFWPKKKVMRLAMRCPHVSGRFDGRPYVTTFVKRSTFQKKTACAAITSRAKTSCFMGSPARTARARMEYHGARLAGPLACAGRACRVACTGGRLAEPVRRGYDRAVR